MSDASDKNSDKNTSSIPNSPNLYGNITFDYDRKSSDASDRRERRSTISDSRKTSDASERNSERNSEYDRKMSDASDRREKKVNDSEKKNYSRQ